jgi:hypothetical protein
MIAQLLRENWPSLPIILVAPLNGHELPLPPRVELLPRPYSIEALVEAVVRLTS